MPKAQYYLGLSDPSVRLLALRELEDRGEDDAEVVRARAEIPATKPVGDVMADLRPEGYWIQRDGRTGKETGAGVEYGAYASTHYRLSYLAELGMDRRDPRVALASERYLGLQASDGDFMSHLSCLLGLNIRTFAKLGYREDPRVRGALDLLLRTERPDAGYLCDMHEKPAVGKSGRPLKRPKSCYRGSVKALMAFAVYPELSGLPRVRALAEYFLGREGLFKRYEPAEYVVREVVEPSFPQGWSADVVQVLYALSTLGYGADPRLARARHALEELRDENGFIHLAWTPALSPWKVGRRGKPSDWITLYADIAEKRADGKRLNL